MATRAVCNAGPVAIESSDRLPGDAPLCATLLHPASVYQESASLIFTLACDISEWLRVNWRLTGKNSLSSRTRPGDELRCKYRKPSARFRPTLPAASPPRAACGTRVR